MAAKQELSAQERYERMTTAPVGPLIASMAVPNIVTHIITSVYNLADTFFVGQLGTSATAAVGVVFSIVSVLNALGFWVATGGSVLMSQYLGAQKNREANTVFSTAFCLSFGLGVLVCAGGLLGGAPLMRFLGATETILPYAQEYGFWILLAAPFTAANTALAQGLRGEGLARQYMVGQMAGGLLNMLLDPLFIFGLRWGVGGAALATAISQAVSWAYMFSFYLRGKTQVKFSVRYLARTGAEYATLLRMGVPSVCRHGCFTINNIVLNTVAGGWGDAAIAAMSITGRLQTLANGVAMGLNQGAQPVIGYANGRGDQKRVRQAYFFMLKFSTLVMVVLGAAAIGFTPQLIGVFRNDPEVIRIGARALQMVCLSLPFLNCINCCTTLFQITGNPLPSSAIILVRTLLFYVPLQLALPQLWDLAGVQAAGPLADVLAACVALPMALRYLKKRAQSAQKPD